MPICVLVSLNVPTVAQHLRLGVIGGTALTSDYDTFYSPEQQFPLPDGATSVFPAYHVRSGSRSPIGGPTLAWEFNDRFSIEANAIYRRLRLQGIGPTVTWQFPILAKYRLPLSFRGVQSFIEGGPSFRTTGNLNTRPSHTGFTAGAGVDWHWRGFRFAPGIRYTRWAADPHPNDVQSRQDQFEVLFAVSRHAISNRRPLGNRVRLGILGGATLLKPVADGSWSTNVNNPGSGLFASSRRYLRTWVVGPRLQADVSRDFALLIEANYRQVRFRETTSFDFVDPNGVRRQGTGSFHGKSAVLWQFPVLMRYKFGRRFAQPFLDFGPSFRLPQDIGGNLSTLGVTGGTGARFDFHGFALEAGLRFSHWGSKKYRSGETAPNDVRRNQLDAVFGFTF